MFLVAIVAVATTLPTSAFAANYTEQLWGTVSVQWVSAKTAERPAQEANQARRACGSWAGYVDNPVERQALYYRCLKERLPADFYRVTDMTDQKAVKARY